ncbi:hypothetical protein M2451_003555 [Dysgonomonas sp. PFB1-18]|uniref:hypothetical protein n=1 Tax=unclassified Dysgonomonas TaxID=2630389 RepID=UPI00247719F4|nr:MULTISPECIES: hypothetical protein [unclassified Dysgonomonas]MDH6310678.1 hypothetical protein [Dysgonomonas sp. PF1-14]MDH6340529.1 hypothetical protein [Dysgonomonas sp. PF1-16]MDH6382215.1 hypothetical protein [Dysgonomonas sp. PFB1-18]MDH6399558.1 hypothetical protein [Dysgonomonas sp. PF1-23]
MNDFFIKEQIVELCDSVVRNINNNFRNISLDIDDEGNLRIKIILDITTEKEYEYIDDISAEFEAVQENRIVKDIEVTTDLNSKPLPHLIYSRED